MNRTAREFESHPADLYGPIGEWLIRLTVYQETVGSNPTGIVSNIKSKHIERGIKI